MHAAMDEMRIAIMEFGERQRTECPLLVHLLPRSWKSTDSEKESTQSQTGLKGWANRFRTWVRVRIRNCGLDWVSMHVSHRIRIWWKLKVKSLHPCRIWFHIRWIREPKGITKYKRHDCWLRVKVKTGGIWLVTGGSHARPIHYLLLVCPKANAVISESWSQKSCHLIHLTWKRSTSTTWTPGWAGEETVSERCSL